MPDPFQKAPDDEQSMFDQLRAQDQRRLTWQRQASPQIAAAIGQFHNLAPHAGPGVALAVGLGNIPPANAAKVANDAAATGVTAAPQSQTDPSNPNFTSNRQIAQIPGLSPEQQAAAAKGVDVAGMTPDQLKQEQKILGVTPDMLAPEPKGMFEFDWTDPLAGPKLLGEGVQDVVRPTLGVAQSGLEEVQNRATVGVQALGNIASSVKEGDLAGAAHAWLGAEAMVNPFSVASLATAPSTALQAAQSYKATTAYQMTVNNLSLGNGLLPNPASPAGQYQAAAARQYRGTNSAGQAWTLGRQLASVVAQPGTTPYKLLSGLTDAAVAWYGDPALVGGQVASEARAAGKIITPAEDVAKARAAVDGADAAKEGVLLQAERPAVGKLTADGWINSPTGQFVLGEIAKDGDALSVHNALNRVAPPDIVNALAKAKTPEEAANILRPVLGIEIKSLNDIRPASTVYNMTQQIKRALPLWDDGGNLISRQFAQIPSKVLRIGSDASARDLTAAVNDADNWMRLVEVPYEERTKVVSNFIDNLANGKRYDAGADLMTALRKGMVAQGVDGDKAQQLTRMFDDYDKGLYGVDQFGKPTTWNLLHTADGATDTSLAGPGLLSERMRTNVEMPDPRVVKRLTSMFGKAISTNEGQDLRMPAAYAERITNVWKRFAILRPATAIRVMGDEQARLAASGMPSAFSHPLHWIMSVTGHQEGLTAFGEHFDDAAALGHMDGYRQALGKSFFGAVDDPNTLHAATYANGNWRAVSKFDEPSRWQEGMVDEIRQLAADPVARRVAKGDTTDQILEWLKSDEGAQTKAAYTDLFKGNPDDATLRDYIDNYTRARIDTKVGDNQALRDVIANNRLPESATGEALYEAPVANSDLTFVKAGSPGDSEWGGTNRWLGATVKDAEGNVGVVTQDLGNGRSAVSYGAQGAFENGTPSDGLRALVKDWHAADESPESVKWAERVRVPSSKTALGDRLDRATNTMVSALFDVPVSKLTRSPAFREAYYQELGRLADRLTPEEANKLIKNISTDAADKGFGDRVAEFLGGDKARDAVVANAAKAHGTMTLADLDQYATGHALDSVRDTLYDVSRRSNFGDAMRTVAPFGQAWAQVLSGWGKVLARNPETVRRFQLAVEGARGSGFFYTDPTTGEETMNVPFSGWAMKKVFGVDSPIKMSVQGLSIAGNFLPGIGPTIAMPAGEIMRRMPTPDFVRAVVLPYGESPTDESSATGGIGDRLMQYALPSWMGKVQSIMSSPDSSSIYGNTYSDVLRQLAASGEYGDSTDERQRMMSDAENKAKAMTVLRGVAQAFLPSAPSYQPTVNTKQGDVLVNKMAQDLSQWQQEDYNTAIGKFLEVYGEGPFIYLQSKTKSVNGGLSASKAFGEWETGHSRFMSSYPDVAGYFAPAESDFDSDVYNRQLATGERTKLSGDQMLKAADATIARWKYNQAKNMMGDKLNADQRAGLATYKAALQQKYPGWAEYNAGTSDFATKIAQLTDAASSKGMADNDAAVGVRSYLKLRDAALSIAKDRGQSSLSGDKMADLREWLDNGAHTLAKSNPSFQRVYDDLLSSETAP